MKKGLIVVLVLAAIVLIGGCQACNLQKSMVTLDEGVKNKWGKVQSSYQRRADLIPNLVATVKGAADFERSTYVEVAKARAGELRQATQVSADSLTPQRLAEIQRASNEAQNAARMMINVAIERYPDLKANQNFMGLQDELSGTENRIAVARNDYNDAVQGYNIKIRTFPNNLFAGMLGFKQKDIFQAEAGAEKRPEVKF